MGNWWLEEPYVSRVVDLIRIDAFGGKPQFSLIRSRNNCGHEIARIDEVDRLLDENCLHFLCDGQMEGFLGPSWDRDWTSVPEGIYFIRLELEGLEFDPKFFEGQYDLSPCGVLEETEPIWVKPVATSFPHLWDFPHLWELFGFLLPPTTRRRVFEPAYNDLLAQHMRSLDRKFDTPMQRGWLNLCFFVHSVRLVFDCYRAFISSALVLSLMKCIPSGVKEWWVTTFFTFFR